VAVILAVGIPVAAGMLVAAECAQVVGAIPATVCAPVVAIQVAQLRMLAVVVHVTSVPERRIRVRRRDRVGAAIDLWPDTVPRPIPAITGPWSIQPGTKRATGGT
jgi:hypothetical protein